MNDANHVAAVPGQDLQPLQRYEDEQAMHLEPGQRRLPTRHQAASRSCSIVVTADLRARLAASMACSAKHSGELQAAQVGHVQQGGDEQSGT